MSSFILLGGIDGIVTCVNVENGLEMWRFDTSKPLLSSSTTIYSFGKDGPSIIPKLGKSNCL
jgi:hypothetical protein